MVQSDAALLTIVAGNLSVARANKCLQLALINADPASSFALINRSLSLLTSTRSELESALRKVGKLPTADEDRVTITALKEKVDDVEQVVRMERTRLRARSIETEQQQQPTTGDKLPESNSTADSKSSYAIPPLINRLNAPTAGLTLDTRNPNLVDFPPNFVPVPCKPLFFDLAAGYIDYNLDAIAARCRGQPESGKGAGISGWLGGWFSGKK